MSAEARFPTAACLMARTAAEFVRREVVPVRARLEAHEDGLLRSLFYKAGALGLLAGNVPSRYGGLGLTKSVSALLSETLGAHDLSFAIGAGVHSGVATFPLLHFGTDMLKQAYLPRLASGESVGAFALSEANSGSDALAAQTQAALSEDGGYYTISGAKQWITNAGMADVFTVFAQADGNRFTAFLIERGWPGVSVGPEENKLGLRGSSTCRLLLDNVHIPITHVIGEVGLGHRPALSALNPGRLAIAATAVGSAKAALRGAAIYARSRSQFGRALGSFPLIRSRLGLMTARIFAAESMTYRLAAAMDADPDSANASPAACALAKVYATDTQDFVIDESLQVHGGYGFSESYAIAHAYRDARVFRIFEGTNDVARLSAVSLTLKDVQAGRTSLPDGDSCAPLHAETLRLAQCLLSLSDAERKEAQEVSVTFADLLADTSVLDSMTARTGTLSGSAQTLAHLCREIVRAEAYRHANLSAPETTAACRELGDAVLQCDGWPWR